MSKQRVGGGFPAPVLDVVRRRVVASIFGGFLWAAAAVAGAVVVMSFKLATSMDVLFGRAVSEGRVFPYTGEAEEQAFLPGMVVTLATVGTLTALAVAFSRGLLRRSRVVWTTVGVGSIVLAVLIDSLIGYAATSIAKDDVSQRLYGSWYVPILLVAALAHAALLTAGVLRSHGRPDGGRYHA